MCSTLVNKAAASRLYLKEPISPNNPNLDALNIDNLEVDNLSSQDSDDGRGKNSSTPNATP